MKKKIILCSGIFKLLDILKLGHGTWTTMGHNELKGSTLLAVRCFWYA